MMNVLLLTLYIISDIHNHGIYEDLMREFLRHGHNVYIVSPTERKNRVQTHIISHGKCQILKVRTGNLQKTKLLEKGISSILVEPQLKQAIKRYFKNIKFDLILYSTPPITLTKVVNYVKKRDNTKTYLLLKDIFPQNAVDLGMIPTHGVKGLIYRYLRNQELKLYQLSDFIGCMSPANVEYIIKHNPEIVKEKAELCPNSIEVQKLPVTEQERIQLRVKYGIPLDKTVFVYGGNLGRPQGVPFIIECLKSQIKNEKVFFLLAGSGTEYQKIEKFISDEKPKNIKLIQELNKNEYDQMIACCDVGLIFLDHRFTIPNFPSRLLSYMQAGLPVLACTDPNTDIGKVIESGGFGEWCESNSVDAFSKKVDRLMYSQYSSSTEYLMKNYASETSYKTIMKHIKQVNDEYA